MIISASRRTDIPAFYAPWLLHRLREGYVLTRNPFNPAQARRVGLTPEEVDCIAFWTKDPAPLLPLLDELDALGYRYYFQFTLTPYGPELERNLRPKEEILRTFIELSGRLGPERVLWRYDPIILNDALSMDYHARKFQELCGRLQGYTRIVTISFVDVYHKLKTPLVREITDGEIAELSAVLANTAGEHGLDIRACCEAMDLRPYGIRPASCIDRETVERLCGHAIDAKPDRNQRPGCGCLASVDIGAYNTCANGCVYCYANYSEKSVERNRGRHDTRGEMMVT